MKTTIIKLFFAGLALTALTVFLTCCNNPANQKEKTAMTEQEKVERGKYLVTICACNDCHSPKIFMPDGTPIADTSRLLSGHPADEKLPPIDTNQIKPGKWYLGSADLTAWVGPWGISYPFNLTPDSVTGIGAWTEEVFINALRKGKHMGTDAGRPILPPMPWFYYGQMTDDDLKSVYAFLRMLKPISNKVPEPVPPTEIGKMTASK